MLANSFWNIFIATGNVEAYLLYKEYLNGANDESD